MAGDWRAVFLRVHPTGKPVLSLSTESDGKESEYAQIVSDELGIAAADVKVVPGDLSRFGDGHGFGTSPSGGTGNAIRSVCGKIKEKAQILAGGMLGTSPQSLSWTGDAFAAGKDPEQGKRIEEIALYAHGGAMELPAGLDGSLDAQTAYRE
ncbi:MAG: molybdopterin-dependent oxidoreductase [Actinomycetota bacterium]|nr:molybdopterin-dependent oxidoreductase [Actinomycetota bacterium]